VSTAQAAASSNAPAAKSPAGTKSAADQLDALGLRALLEHELIEPHEPGVDEKPPPVDQPIPTDQPAPANRSRWQRLAPTIRRAAKSLLGLAVLLVFGWQPLKSLLQASSVEAIVNARIVTVRAQIDGTLSPAGEGGGMSIVNPRASKSRVLDLTRTIARYEDELQALQQKLAAATARRDRWMEKISAFQSGRVKQLEARIAELTHTIAVASARAQEAKGALARASTLSSSYTMSAADLARAQRDATVASETETALRHQLEGTQVELEAARSGLFVGDSYNDQPSSVQRAEEVNGQIADFSADIALHRVQIDRLRRDLAEETRDYDLVARSEIVLPEHGRLWEALVSPGEEVHRGQDLFRYLDCATAVVTANVTETVYNQLSLGTTARFNPSDGGAPLEGRVVNLTGVASAAGNYAIEPASLSREPFRVTAQIVGMAAGRSCPVGRTGRVVFGKPS
jgi:multidrug resistance efflux pump